MQKEKVRIRLLDNYCLAVSEDGQIPVPGFARKGDAGVDLRNMDKDVEVCSGRTYSFPTGLSMAIPMGWCGLVLERSGLGRQNGVVIHGRVVDSGYRGEIFVLLSAIVSFRVYKYQRIAQIVFVPHLTELEYVGSLEDTERGGYGFGSTGHM